MAQSGNGVDLGAIYQLLSEVAQTVRSHGDEFDRIRRNFDGLNRTVEDVTASIADLRAAVTEYHATVVGHGILYSELEERVRRLERHVRLEPTRT